MADKKVAYIFILNFCFIEFGYLSSMKKEFSMIQKLGGGSFGNVYLIKRKDTKEMMAAKHQKIRSEDDRRHIRREVEILDILDTRNPDIVTLIDYFESAQECVILTEYLLGGELFERISSSEYELTENKCKGFMRQVMIVNQSSILLKIPISRF